MRTTENNYNKLFLCRQDNSMVMIWWLDYENCNLIIIPLITNFKEFVFAKMFIPLDW